MAGGNREGGCRSWFHRESQGESRGWRWDQGCQLNPDMS